MNPNITAQDLGGNLDLMGAEPVSNSQMDDAVLQAVLVNLATGMERIETTLRVLMAQR
ncbi:MAG: hypothetical protein ACRD2R_04470 [Terriglobales bacterium]